MFCPFHNKLWNATSKPHRRTATTMIDFTSDIQEDNFMSLIILYWMTNKVLLGLFKHNAHSEYNTFKYMT